MRWIALLAVAGACASARGGKEPLGSPWRKDPPRLTAYGALAPGRVKMDIAGIDDDAAATKLRFMGEWVRKRIGAGVAVDLLFADELFAGNDSFQINAFPRFVYVVRGGDRFRLPLRAGLWLDFLRVEGLFDDPALSFFNFFGAFDDLHVTTAGLRVEVEPEFDIVSNKLVKVSVFVSLAGGAGVSEVQAGGTTDNGDRDDSGGSNFFRAEVGGRVNLRRFAAALSYVIENMHVDRTDHFPDFDYGFHGLFLSFGVRW